MKILLVDDHTIIRKGLLEILSKEYKDCEFFEASNGIEAISVLKQETLDIALMDISMPRLNGLEVLKQIKVLDIKTPIIILSMQPEDQYALRVLKAGAHGFLNKDSKPEIVLKAVHRVLSGKKYISEMVADMLVDNVGIKKEGSLIETLSDREMEVFQFISRGKTLTEISDEMSLSVNTISTYRSRIMQKLGLKNNASLIRYAIDNNIL